MERSRFLGSPSQVGISEPALRVHQLSVERASLAAGLRKSGGGRSGSTMAAAPATRPTPPITGRYHVVHTPQGLHVARTLGGQGLDGWTSEGSAAATLRS